MQVTTLDHPFTVSNIPVSQTDPAQTAQAIQNYFEAGATTYSTGVGPWDFPPPDRINVNTTEAPYTAPVYVNNGSTVATPVTVVTPSILVRPVINPDGTFSYTQFDVTFTGISGTQNIAPMVVTNATDENAVGIGTNVTELLDNTVELTVGSTESQVQTLKQSGNEFQVNPAQPSSVYSQSNLPPNSEEPSVAMSGAGNFVIAWSGGVSQQLAPKDVTDVFFRMYEPLGIAGSYSPGTFVPGAVISDIVKPGESATDPAQYEAESFTGVRLLPNPAVAEVQKITFGAAISGTTFQLQLGSVVTGSIAFDANNLTGTAGAMQSALVAAGFSGATVAYVTPSVQTTTPSSYSFTVKFQGASTGVDEPPIQYVPGPSSPPVTFTQSNVTTDPYTIMANANYTNPQSQPAAAMDIFGNITVVWANRGMDVSYFNTISMQRYDKLGKPLGGQVTVNTDNTNIAFSPAVAVGADGYVVVTWSETTQAAYLQNEPFTATVYVRGFSPQTVPLWNEVAVNGVAGYSTIAMDGQDNFTVAGETNLADTDVTIADLQAGGTANLTTVGVYAVEYQLLSAPATPLAAPAVLRPLFRLNSGSTNAASQTIWPFDQRFPSVQMGLNGDIAATYQGYGPAVSADDLDIPATFFRTYIPNNPNLPNGDLLPYFNPYKHKTFTGATVQGDSLGVDSLQFGALSNSLLYYGNYNVDSAIDQVLFAAEYPGTIPGDTNTPATPEQLGRLRAILENAAGLLRGESNGILMSQWDANPANATGPTYSDNVVNTQRDGIDQRYYLTIPADVQQGSFQLRITVGPATVDPVDLPPAFRVTTGVIQMPSTVAGQPGGPIDVVTTMDNIATAINAALGTVWPQLGVPDSGSVQVRDVSGTEITARNGTEWQVPTAAVDAAIPTVTVQPANALANGGAAYLFELIFQGQAHDIPLSIQMFRPNDQQWIGTPTVNNNNTTYNWALGGASPPVITLGDFTGNQGTAQYNAALSMSASGDMVAAYTSQALQTDGLTVPTDSSGNAIYSNIYTEQLAESTDTAGPRVVAWTDSNGRDLLPQLGNNAITATGVNSQYFVLGFDEPLQSGDPAVNPDSVYNLQNYQLYNSSGTLISSAITQVSYGLSEVAQMAATIPGFATNPTSFVPDNKWEVVLTLNGGTTPLSDGTYTLTILNAIPASSTTAGQTGLRNLAGTPLNLSAYNPGGLDFTSTVTISQSSNAGQFPGPPGLTQTDLPINSVRGGLQSDPSIASANNLDSSNPAANGNYVVVWTSTVNGATNIMGQLFQEDGTLIGPQFTVNSSASTSWATPDVSMDSAGNFVVVWSGAGPNSNARTNPSDIFARRFNAKAQPIGTQFQVDQYSASTPNQSAVQNQPTIAVAPDGTFVIAWTTTPIPISNTTTANSTINVREYNANGVPVNSTFSTAAFQPGGNAFKVSTTAATAQLLPDVAMDANDDFIIVWEGDFQASSTWGVYGNYYTNAGQSAVGASFVTSSGAKLLTKGSNSRGTFTNASTAIDLRDTGPRVAMDPAGNFVATWANYQPSTTTGYNILAQQFLAGGAARGNAFQVNQSPSQLQPNLSPPTIGWQVMPAVGVDANGEFTIAWTGFGQDNADIGNPALLDYGIYTRMYDPNGNPLAASPNEFRVNATTAGNQLAPAVASTDPQNNSIIVWIGPDTAAAGTTAVYLRNVDPPVALPAALKPAPMPSISLADTSVSVGTAPGTATFTATLSYRPTKPVSVVYSTSNGTAKAGSNYTDVSGTLTFAAGQTSKTFTVRVAGLSAGSLPVSTFQVHFASPVNGKLARSTATATIVNALNVPAPSISVGDISASVGTTAASAVFTVSLSAAYTKTVTIAFSTADGTAKAGVNYTAKSGTLTFAPGQTSQTIAVPLAALTAAGLPSKTFQLKLATPVNATIARSSATGTIVDAVPVAPTPSISVGDVSASVGAAGGQAVFTVVLLGRHKEDSHRCLQHRQRHGQGRHELYGRLGHAHLHGGPDHQDRRGPACGDQDCGAGQYEFPIEAGFGHGRDNRPRRRHRHDRRCGRAAGSHAFDHCGRRKRQRGLGCGHGHVRRQSLGRNVRHRHREIQHRRRHRQGGRRRLQGHFGNVDFRAGAYDRDD